MNHIIESINTKVYKLLFSRRNPIKYAKKIGVNVGERCKLIGSPNWGTEPWLITIGNHTSISFDCVFITHDGATWTFREEKQYRDVIRYGKIRIGNDCFIGARSTILPGVKVGDRCIIGAGSLVTKSVPSGEVWGGVPARFITTTTEYASKCLKETPEYEKGAYRENKKKEILRVYPDV